MGGRGSSYKGRANTPSGKTLKDFQKMGYEEMGDFYWNYVYRGSDMQLPPELTRNSRIQRFIYALGINGKPKIVDDDEFAQLVADGATPVYRGVDTDEHHDYMMEGDYPWMGNGIYGDGLYFASRRRDAGGYGSHVAQAVLNENARVVDYTEILRQQKAQSRAMDAARDAYAGQGNSSKAKDIDMASRMFDDNSDVGITALKQGYNVISTGGANPYYVVLDRSALTMTRTRAVKPGSHH